ncbi:MAG: type II secretion system F family protein [Anaerolineales bacterium]|nr:MAG: type II secretion system F family protein [Anaerolineales bacterium]
MSPVVLIVAMAILGSVVLLFVGVAAPRSSDQVMDRLTEYGGRTLTLEEIELSQPFSQRIIKPVLEGIAQLLGRLTPQRNIEETRRKLELAGKPYGWGSTEFLGIRGLAGILLATLTFLLLTLTGQYLPKRFLATAVAGGLGFYVLPTLWLSGQIRRRQTEILKALPDALDLLTISVEAGLGFDAALSKVAEKWENELSLAFTRVIQEIQMGKLRREALRDMADRMDVSDVSSFVAAIIQADQLGVSIAKVLRIQSEQMRIRRRQRAEEKAHQAPVKMLFPMVFLIFPALLVILLGPAILVVMSSGVLGVI